MSNVSPVPFLVDSHCHLDLEAFDQDRDAVLERARGVGVGLLVIPGIDLAQCRQAIRLAEGHRHLFVAVGIHPNSTAVLPEGWLEELRLLSSHPKVVAIGEIGLDYHWELATPAEQRTAFEAQLGLAAASGLPVIIHSRKANDDVAAILRTWVGGAPFRGSALARRPFAGVLHAFSGDLALAEEAYRWNFVLGLGGPVTFKNAHHLRALVPQLRMDRLMLETDAPYLAPHPYRGQRNEPAYLALVCTQLAQLCQCSEASIAEVTSAVAQRFFQVEELFGADVAKRSKITAA